MGTVLTGLARWGQQAIPEFLRQFGGGQMPNMRADTGQPGAAAGDPFRAALGSQGL